MKLIVRFFCHTVMAVIFAPILLLFAVVCLSYEAWRRLELWAFYDGDENARAKVEAGY